MVSHVPAYVMTIVHLLSAPYALAVLRLLRWTWIKLRGTSPFAAGKAQEFDVASTVVRVLKVVPRGAAVHYQGPDGTGLTIWWAGACGPCGEADSPEGRRLW
jgi:hypothetical protein